MKTETVILCTPTGFQTYDAVEVTSLGRDSIRFSKREENGEEVTITDYTSNLPYVITSVMTGPKTLL